MRMLHGLRVDRAGEPESHTWIAPVGIGRRFCDRQDLEEPRLPHAAGTLGRPSNTVRLMRRVGEGLLLAALTASGQWRAAAVVVPPATNRVVLTWRSLGPGTRYYVQTSTNLLTWTAATNTTATNVSLTLIGDKARMFRLSATNAPPQSATLAWDPSVPSTNVAGYFLYYGGATGRYTNRFDVGLPTSGVVSNLVAGTTYYFAVTAHDSSGLESAYSNEAAWQCPLRLRIQRLP
jgi:hypothetical protein